MTRDPEQTDVQRRDITPGEIMSELDVMGRELDQLAKGLAYVCRELDTRPDKDTPSIAEQYTKAVDDFELGLWEKSQNDDGFKLPSEAMRLKLAHRAMDPTLYGRYFALVKSRDRLVKRISALKASIQAQQSLLSAMKEGLADTRPARRQG